MAIAQLLSLTHGVDHNVRDIGDMVRALHEGAQNIKFSYFFLRKRLFGQMEKKQKLSCNRQQKRRLQICNLWQTMLAK